jgi:hypothetical protein
MSIHALASLFLALAASHASPLDARTEDARARTRVEPPSRSAGDGGGQERRVRIRVRAPLERRVQRLERREAARGGLQGLRRARPGEDRRLREPCEHFHGRIERRRGMRQLRGVRERVELERERRSERARRDSR